MSNTGKWFTIDESTLLIERAHKKWRNIFKAHILSFFDRQAEDSLKFCLAEITTLLDSNAIGEVYVFSHFHDSEANKIRDKYKQIIEQVKNHKEFRKASISAYKDWYSQDTWIYIGHNPEPRIKFTNKHFHGWNNDGEAQKEERARANYATLNDELSHEYIEKYLNYYIELLKKDLGFDKYEHFAVIVKPLNLVDEDEIIPVGNLYLHFVTDRPFTEEIYKCFLNEFTNIYLRGKGGRLLKEFEIAAKTNGYMPPHTPNLDSKLVNTSIGTKLPEVLKEYYAVKENYDILIARRDTLRQELQNFLLTDGKFDKEATRAKSLKQFPLISELIKARPHASAANATKKASVIDDFLLIRHMIFVLLCCLRFTPAEVHAFLNKEGFWIDEEMSLDNYYQFYYNKFYIYIKESATTELFSTDLVKANTLKKQGSKLEQDFVEYFQNLSKTAHSNE